MTPGGRLLHSYRAGKQGAGNRQRLRQHDQGGAALANVTGNVDDLNRARAWTQVLDHHYWAEDIGGYFLAADDTGDLIVRTINALDDATPNANGTMVSNLMAALFVDRRGALSRPRRGNSARLQRRRLA